MPYNGPGLSIVATQIQQDSVAISTGSENSPTLAFIGDTNNGIFSPALDNLAVTTNGSEKLRIIANGNVGIATTNPHRVFA